MTEWISVNEKLPIAEPNSNYSGVVFVYSNNETQESISLARRMFYLGEFGNAKSMWAYDTEHNGSDPTHWALYNAPETNK